VSKLWARRRRGYDVVSALVHSANYQKSEYGFYTPIARWSGSYADHIALYLFQLFDAHYEQNDKDFEHYALDYINNSVWENQEYAKNHIYEIALLVFEELEKQNKGD